MVVTSTFKANPNSQIILHQNSTHQFYSTAKSSTLSCHMFKSLKLAQVSSTKKIMCPFAMPYMKWATSRVQHLFNLRTFSPTASSLIDLYNADLNIWTCAFIGFVVDFDKTKKIIGNKKKSFGLSIKRSF